MKQFLKTSLIVILVLIACISAPWLLLYLGLSAGEDPPKPAYSYGEFPFYLEYEINGQRIIVDDKVIVKYAGIGLSEGTGKYIKWKQTLGSGNKEVILFEDGESETLIFTIRDRDYHLEENEEGNKYDSRPDVYRKARKENMRSVEVMTERELLKYYKIKLIKFEYGEPLKKRLAE
ncbi:hypothetical protein [Paenibacillus sp. NPDC058174]|uniref:hypothetical protein n=1 Tax=Paenibacillus sp. NPDC058174 TaxID=3346366 RepID=UPI0036D9381D